MSTDESPEKGQPAPSGLSERVEKFTADQAAEAAKVAEAKDAPPGEKKEEEKPPETPEKKAPKPKLRLVGEDGKEVPFSMTVEGKEISEQDLEKVRTWAQLGIHANQRLEAINKREQALNEAEPMLAMILEGIKDGRISVPKKKTGEAKPEPEGDNGKPEEEASEEEGFVDPEIKALKDQNKSLRGELDKLRLVVVGDKVKQVKQEIEDGIKANMEKFPLADEDEVWRLLGQLNEDGNPTFNVEKATEHSHKRHTARFEAWAKKNRPEYYEVSDEKKQTIINEYLAAQEKKSAAPVAAPSGTPAPTSAKKEKKFTGLDDAFEQAAKDLNPALAQGRKA